MTTEEMLPAMAMEQLAKLEEVVHRHEQRIRIYAGGYLSDKVVTLINHYDSLATNALVGSKAFRDDVVIWLRAMSLIIDMAANAATHKEKNARLRGCIELCEASMQKLRQMEFDFQRTFYFLEDVFRSDYPVRHFVDRIHELERELEEAKKATASGNGAVATQEASTEVGERLPAKGMERR
ncbi:MAG TPA: hypothetical protein VFI95_25915 [Terriglobales bacterium]|nr:hypothetical protein [Terriglobales bacterium]